MGPARTGKNLGAFQFDRRFRGVGRIKKTSGTTSLREFRRRDALLTKLFETSALEVLRAFQAGTVTIEEIVEADRGNLSAMSLSRVATTQQFTQAIVQALPKMGTAETTRDRYQYSLEKLLRELPALNHAPVGSLATVNWRDLDAQWTAGPADWNNMRRAVSRFLTVHLGDKFHPLRRAIMTQMPQRREVPRTPDQSPELFLKLVASMPEPARPCFMTLALTGMRIGEYIHADETALRPATRSVAVTGKTGEGVVYMTIEGFALARAAIPCPLGPTPRAHQQTTSTTRYRRLSRVWHAAQKDNGVSGLTLHDLRHLFAQTSADSGVPTAQTQAQMRHSDPKMTRRYEMSANARKAAEAVAEQLGITPKPVKTARKRAG
jgi:integrase